MTYDLKESAQKMGKYSVSRGW